MKYTIIGKYRLANFKRFVHMDDIIIQQQGISKFLNHIEEIIQMQNTAGIYSWNKVAENIFKDILNIVYNYELENVNLNISNYPAIDLASTNGSKICYQVTSTNDSIKIKNTIKTFIDNELNKEFDSLIFILLKPKKNYDAKKIENFVNELVTQKGIKNFGFDLQKSIIDKNSLYNIIATRCSPDQINDIYILLKKYYEGHKKQSNLSSYYEQLKDSFHEVVMEDESGMTLNDIYIEPDFLYYSDILNDAQSKDQSLGITDNFVNLQTQVSNIVDLILRNESDYLTQVVS